MNRMTLTTALAGILAVATLAAGCGDDDDSRAPAAPTKAEFITQADEICAAGDKEIDADSGSILGGEARDGQPSPEQIERIVNDALAPGIQSQIDQIRELTPPEGDEAAVAAFLDSAEAGVGVLVDEPDRLITDEDPFAEASKLAGEYGLKVCAAGS